MSNDRAGDRAIVIGGSLAGLLAARVLADRFSEVVLVERDTFPETAGPRKGVPHSRHLHVLLARGSQVLEHLFPGLIDELEEAGAVPVRWPQDVLWMGAAGWGNRTARGLTIISVSRDLLEQRVRRRVFEHDGVRPIEEHDAIGLVAPADRSTVAGVRVRARPAVLEFDLEGDLVVDASGRGSQAPRWLGELGYEAPEQTVVNASLGYASRFYERPADADPDWLGLFFQPKIGQTRGGGLFPLDGNRWHATLAGIGGDYPPTEEDGFLAFARSLRSPILADAIAGARPLTPIVSYRRTENQLRAYDRLGRWPERFVVIGDAVCCFNPIYGQGMTMAGESALLLRRWLRDEAPAHEFQQRLRRTVETPWLLATGEDFRYPTTEGGRPSAVTRLMHRYLDRLNATAMTDDVVAHRFIRVLQMVAPPAGLFHPEIVGRVLRGPTAPVDGLGQRPHRPAEVAPARDAVAGKLDEGFLQVDDGLRLHYVASGSGPLVLLLHGFPEFWYSWRHQLPALAAAGYRAVAIDLPGFNLSDRPRDPDAYLLPILSWSVGRAIQELGSDSATVVAHDFGGGVGWGLAMQEPSLVERLVAINSPHPRRFAEGIRNPDQLRRSWYIGLFQLPLIAEAVVRWGDYADLRKMLAAVPNGAFAPADVERYIEAISRPGALTAGLNYYRGLPRLMLRGGVAVKPIEVPVLVIWGDEDPYLGVELAEPDPALVPNARVEHLPRVGHFVQNEAPDRVNELLLDFVREARPLVMA